MKLHRTPVLTMVEPKVKAVTLYQIPSDIDSYFGHRLFGHIMGNYVPMEKMVPVAEDLVDASVDDITILNAAFLRYNSNADDGLLYSMSVGDVITIDGIRYRCTAGGWDRF